MELAELNVADRQIWVRAFYGFDPEGAGYIGFTKEGQRRSMMEQMRTGDLVLIYGAVEDLTDPHLRAQALGFLEVEVARCRDIARMSAASYQWKLDRGFENRWNYGILVRRAWRVRNRVRVATIAPKAFDSRKRFERTTTAVLLDPDERERALSHPVRQVNVFGEPSIAKDDLTLGTLETVLTPSRGIKPSLGARTSNYEDGENSLYLMLLTDRAEALLSNGAAGFGHALAKIGRTNDISRREGEINCGFPVKSRFRWKLERHHFFSSVDDAHTAETTIKKKFAAMFQSQGNEFFSGDKKQMVAAFEAFCTTNGPRILGAPGKARGL